MPNDPDQFNNFNGMNKPDPKDDFIDSSFAVQFKPGDKSESVADKLKESKDNLNKAAENLNAASNGGFGGFQLSSDNDAFMDEFDKFEFDSSIKAFKPFKAPEEPQKPAEPAKADKPSEPVARASAATANPEKNPFADSMPVQTSSEPAFPKDGGTFDKPAFVQKAPEPPKDSLPKFNDLEDEINNFQAKPSDEKIFKSGNGLDFATSEHDKKSSPFMNAEVPEAPKPANIDIPGTEKPEAKPVAATAPVAPTAPAAPVAQTSVAPAEPSKAPGVSDKQKPVSPANRPAAQAVGYRPYPSANKTDVFSTPTQAAQAAQAEEKAKEAVKPVEQAQPAAPAKPVEAAKPAAVAAPVSTSPFVASTRPGDSAKHAEPVKPADTARHSAPVNQLLPLSLLRQLNRLNRQNQQLPLHLLLL